MQSRMKDGGRPCGLRIILDFVRDPSSAPDTTCTADTLPPNVGKGFLAIDPQLPQYRPRMPPGYSGRTVSALLRVCTDREGNVVEVKVLKGYDPSVDAAFVSALRTWRYSPFKVEGRPVPFCTNVAYSVQTTN